MNRHRRPAAGNRPSRTARRFSLDDEGVGLRHEALPLRPHWPERHFCSPSHACLDPRGDIGGVVVANLGGQVAVCGNEGGAKLGHKLFHGVTFVAKLLAAKVAVEAGRVTSSLAPTGVLGTREI
jgi:hypothetical protein